MNNEAITEAVHASIAKAILDGLDTEARDAILQKSIEKALEDYTFRSAVEKMVADKASRVVCEMVESQEWENRIVETIRNGFEDYLQNLRAAIPGIITLSLHGKNGDRYNGQAARILECWPSKEKV